MNLIRKYYYLLNITTIRNKQRKRGSGTFIYIKENVMFYYPC